MTKKKAKEIRTEEIVQAAVQEFLERGYEGASMDNIARRASLSKGGLYHHFRSKDEILIYANQPNDPAAHVNLGYLYLKKKFSEEYC